jgi:zinc protease
MAHVFFPCNNLNNRGESAPTFVRLRRALLLCLSHRPEGDFEMRMKRLFVILLAVSLSAPAAALAQRRKKAAAKTTGSPAETSVLPPINFTQFTLANGLRVIFHEDHSTPIVAVNVWYHVGSKNEVPGRTGFAHLFEHMMFQG